MKRRLLLLLFATLSLLPALAVDSDYDIKLNNLAYKIGSGGVVVMMIGNASGSVSIPSSVTYDGRTYSVIGIADQAFTDQHRITSISIPSSVTSIGSRAFYNCSITSVTIPNSVKSIGKDAFYGCNAMEKAEFASIEHLCSISFGNAYSNPLRSAHHLYIDGEEVAEATIPGSVTKIGDYAFCGCSGLTSVTIPNSVASIGNGAFYQCTGLTSVTIPNSVTSIGNYTFYQCVRLTSVDIPNSVTHIGDHAFYYCNILASVDIPNFVTYIGPNSFACCYALPSIDIPSTVTKIGSAAFYLCRSLTSIDIPSSVTEIGDSLLCKCSGLTSVTIPNSVTTIGNFAFYECSGLTSVIIPNSVTTIGYPAFGYCSGLKKSAYPNTLSDPFYYGISVGYNPQGAIVEDGWIYGPEKEEIRFAPWDLQGEYVISENVTSIGDAAFNSCTDLSSVTFPATLTEISNRSFSGCTSLTKVLMSPAVETIGQDAFSGCTDLSTIVMGPKVKTIDENAFNGATPQNIYITAQTPPSGSGFSDYSATLWLQGQSAIDAYREETNFWHSFNSSEMTVPSKLVVNKVETRTTAIQLAATLEPADVTLPYVFWYTSDPEVATVDAEGLVTIKDDTKECKITAKTLYANGPEAYITVNNGQTTALEEINPDVSTTLPESVSGVYNLRGVKVGTSTSGLPSGLYIVRQGSSVKKIAI